MEIMREGECTLAFGLNLYHMDDEKGALHSMFTCAQNGEGMYNQRKRCSI